MVILYIYRTFVENVNMGRHTRAGRNICTYTYTYSHIYEGGGGGGGGGDEREYIHISGDSSPICKRHLESLINYCFPNRLVETSGDWMDWQHWVHKTQDEDKQYRHIKHTLSDPRPTPTCCPQLSAPLSKPPPPPPPPVSDILTTGYIDLCSCPLPLIFMLLHL